MALYWAISSGNTFPSSEMRRLLNFCNLKDIFLNIYIYIYIYINIYILQIDKILYTQTTVTQREVTVVVVNYIVSSAMLNVQVILCDTFERFRDQE